MCIIGFLLNALKFFNGFAQVVQYNQEFQVNTFTDYNQRYPEVCELIDNGYVICWVSDNQDGNGEGIFAQIYNSDRTPRGSEFQVNTSYEGDQDRPAISSLLDGGFIVCWENYSLEGSVIAVLAQIFNSDGIRRGEEIIINSLLDTEMKNPGVCGLSDSGFVVCWGLRTGFGNAANIYGQIFDKNGKERGQEFQINTTESAIKGNLSAFHSGGFVVGWTGYDEYGNSRGIFAQHFDNNGLRIGNEFQVNSYVGIQAGTDICTLSNSEFVVCWNNRDQDGDELGIFAQRFTSDSLKIGEEFQVNTYVNNSQAMSDIGRLNDGGFVICWQSRYQDGEGSGIYAQMYDKSGNKDGYEFQVNSYTADDQRIPSLSGLANGDFVVCWESGWYQDGDGYGIYGKYYLGEPISHVLESFSLRTPYYDATLDSNWINFRWQQATKIHNNFFWEVEYTLYLDNSDEFNDPESFSGIFDTTYSVQGLIPGQTYFWKILAKNIDGDSLWSSETFGFYISPDATDIEDDPILKPQTFKLYHNYPNPFNPSTMINYQLPIISEVDLSVYNMLGQKIVTLVSERQNAGYHQVMWDASQYPSGVYFLILEAGNDRATQKMLLVK